MAAPVRRTFLELVIHKLALARELNYKPGWVWHEIKRELCEGSELEGVYRSELAYLARRLGYRPRWVHFAYTNLEERFQLGAEPDKGTRGGARGKWEAEKEPHFSGDPLQAALNFFNLDRCYSLPQLKSVYRSLAIRYHPDTGGTHDSFLILQQHYEILKRHAR
jgi:hypothetical protein